METDTFLEHYGIMGMHWGQRKAETSTPLTKEQKSDRNLKVLKLVGGVLALSAGITAAMIIPRKKIPFAKGRSAVSTVLKNKGAVKLNLLKLDPTPSLTPSQISNVNTAYNRWMKF